MCISFLKLSLVLYVETFRKFRDQIWMCKFKFLRSSKQKYKKRFRCYELFLLNLINQGLDRM
jgi:hypothetical protein